MSKLRDGRTSDLIRRFENLSLGKTPGSPEQKAAPVHQFKRNSLNSNITNNNNSRWSHLIHDANAPTMPSVNEGEEDKEEVEEDDSAAHTSFPLLDDTPPLQPTTKEHYGAVSSSPLINVSDTERHDEQSSIHRSEQLRPSIHDVFGISPLSPRSFPAAHPLRKSSTSGKSINDTLASPNSYRKEALGIRKQSSAASSLASPEGALGAQRRKSFVTLLNKKAEIDKSLKASAKSWLKTASNCVNQARANKSIGKSDEAYVMYMKSCNILTGIIPKLRDYDTIKRDPVYLQLHRDLSKHIVPELEELAAGLRQKSYPPPLHLTTDGAVTSEHLDDIESSFTKKFPKNPSDVVVSPSVEALSYTSSVASSNDNWLQAYQSKFNEIDTQAQIIDSSGPQSSTTIADLSISPMQLSNLGQRETKNSNGSFGRNKDTDDSFIPAHSVTCTPPELWRLIQNSRTSIGGRPSILILDVRAHQDFVWGRIDHRYLVNIDPIGLRNGCTSSDIEGSLLLVSEEQQEWFKKRGQFDLVVYLSQSARSFADSDHSQTHALENLVSAIYHYEVDNPLKRSPLLLIGGFDAWVHEVGKDRCLWSEDSQRQTPQPIQQYQHQANSSYQWPSLGNNPEQISGFIPPTSTSKSAVVSPPYTTGPLMNQSTVPDSQLSGTVAVTSGFSSMELVPQVTHAQQIHQDMLKFSGGITHENATGQTSIQAGSVFDFFQQNSRYRMQMHNSEGRYLPSHSSSTNGYNTALAATDASPTHTPITTVTETNTVADNNAAQSMFNEVRPAPTSTPIPGPGQPASHSIANQSQNMPSIVNSSSAQQITTGFGTHHEMQDSGAIFGSSVIRRRKTIFDNPVYGFTGSTNHTETSPYTHSEHPEYSQALSIPTTGVEPARSIIPMSNSSSDHTFMQERSGAYTQTTQKETQAVPALPPKPPAYRQSSPQEATVQVAHQTSIDSAKMMQGYPPSVPLPPIPQIPSSTTRQKQMQTQSEKELPQKPYQPPQQQRSSVVPAHIYNNNSPYPTEISNTRKFYAHPVAAGSDPSLNGRMHAGANLRNTVISPLSQPTDFSTPGVDTRLIQARKKSLESDTIAYGATGLKNFGNTCFMNSVVQCLAGTTPFVRYFLQGGWKKDLVPSKSVPTEVAIEFARLVDSLWRGQYGSISPIAFRSAVGKQSVQFKGNDQEDSQEFGSFLLDALHESLNRIYPRPPPDKELTKSEEEGFEKLPDIQQSDISWGRYIRRNWSIVTSIFQGQVQSRLVCMSCKYTSTTYATFTELSIPIPTSKGSKNILVRRNNGSSRSQSVNIYQCLDAYSVTEVLDGEDRWHCPRCKTKRKATKKLLISRLPLVLIVHLKRFSTIGHFREKLETNVSFPTRGLQMANYVMPSLNKARVMSDGQQRPSTEYNLYAVTNHYGTLSGGHYTASVFNGLRGQWNYFDDTRVSATSEDKIVSPAAYLLFFVQSRT